MARRIEVEITGNSRNLEQALDRSAKAANDFNTDLAAGAAKATGTLIAFGLAADAAARNAESAFGKDSPVTGFFGDIDKAFASLVDRDIVGFFKATASATESSGKKQERYNAELEKTEQAAKVLKNNLDVLAFSQREYNTTIVDGTKYLVAFKGAHDATFGGAPSVYGALTSPPPARPTNRPLGPSEKRAIALIGQQGPERLGNLYENLRQLEGARARGFRIHARAVQNAEKIAETEAEIQGILEAQTAAREAAARVAAAEALAARERARLAREAALAAAKARQLGVLQDPLPTPANLRRQLAGLQARRGELPRNIRDRLGAIGRLLSSGGEIYDETREGIRDYFRMVSGEFSKGEELLKPVATRGLNTGALVKGLGLSAVQNRRIQNRLAGVNVAGQAVADVYLDGEKVGRVQKRHGQRDRINSPKQKRGPNAGR